MKGGTNNGNMLNHNFVRCISVAQPMMTNQQIIVPKHFKGPLHIKDPSVQHAKLSAIFNPYGPSIGDNFGSSPK
jgi:hypothetical protein